MEKSDRDIAAFLESLPAERRDDLKKLDAAISAEMSGLERMLYVGKLWGGSDQEIIGYGTITNRRANNKEITWFLIGLASQQRYISVYISAVEDRQYLSEKYGPDVGKVKVGKSSISFARLADIDLAKLTALVAKARKITEVEVADDV